MAMCGEYHSLLHWEWRVTAESLTYCGFSTIICKRAEELEIGTSKVESKNLESHVENSLEMFPTSTFSLHENV